MNTISRGGASALKTVGRFFLNLILLAIILLGCSRDEQAAVMEQAQEEKAVELLLANISIETETVSPEIVLQQTVLEESASPEINGPRFYLSVDSAMPGEHVTVAYYNGDLEGRQPRSFQAVLLNQQGRRLSRSSFFRVPAEDGEHELLAAILAIPNTAAFGNATIRIESSITESSITGSADGVIRELPFIIERREFPSETLHLDQENTNIRIAPNPQRTVESEELWALLVRTGTEIYTTGPFVPPVTSTRRTSEYGYRRVYIYADGGTDTSIHAGLDYGIVTGTPVAAAARGRVVMAKSRIVTGNTVILEHLPGVYSLYYHMDTIAVAPGEIVETGHVLGGSGSTGLATGPHLHWEMRVSGEYADPDAFLFRPILDKNDIFNKMVE